ncbi:MAG: BadF/BadG/BcrA/BcrD ATPase family protein [Pseudomonadota bacterium]
MGQRRNELVLLVDGGGTGTRVRLLRHGQEIGGGTAGPSNLGYGVDAAWVSILNAYREAAAECGIPKDGAPTLSLWCGLAGASIPGVVEALREAAPSFCERIDVCTDGLASLIGAHEGRPGAVLAVGTGVAALALAPEGKIALASGWGFKAGDEGGGAWIGRESVSLLAKALDGRIARVGALLDALASTVGASYGEVQVWLAKASATTFAGLAPLVVKSADEGDPLAERILRQAVEEVEMALRAVAPAGPVALLGGLAGPLSPRLSMDVKARIVPPAGNALDGLALLAAHDCGGEDFIRNGGLPGTWDRRSA